MGRMAAACGSDIHPDLIKEYLQQSGQYDYKWPGSRCPACDKPCKSDRGVKIHLHSCPYRERHQNFAGTRADKKVQEAKAEVLQKNKPVVTCENLKLKNIFKFKYLGSGSIF